jgi:hypothetical protein
MWPAGMMVHMFNRRSTSKVLADAHRARRDAIIAARPTSAGAYARQTADTASRILARGVR